MDNCKQTKIALDNAAQKMNDVITTSGILTKNDILHILNMPEDRINGDKIAMTRRADNSKKTELEEIESITNKDVRDKLLEEYHKRN